MSVYLTAPISPPSKILPLKLRPADQVRKFLFDGYAENGRRDGRRLPSVRQVASSLGVSTATVQTVYQKLAEEGIIKSKVGSGSFWCSSISASTDDFYLGINVPVPQIPSELGFQVCGGLMMAISQRYRSVALRAIQEKTNLMNSEAVCFSEASRSANGVVVFPSPFEHALRRQLECEGKHFVSLVPASEATTSNFVSADYYNSSRLLTAALHRAGRCRIAFVMSATMESSVAVRLRCAGAISGLGEALGRAVDLRIYTAEPGSEEAGRQALDLMLAEGYRPDAIYCEGGFLAIAVVHRLLRMGVRVPEEVSVFGENQLGGGRSITGVLHDLSQLGNELGKMLLRRCNRDGLDQPGIFLPVNFALGKTTRNCENEIIEELLQSSFIDRHNC